jgi:hypothetical protein
MSLSFRFGIGGLLFVVVASIAWIRSTLEGAVSAFESRSNQFAAATIPTSQTGSSAGGFYGCVGGFNGGPVPDEPLPVLLEAAPPTEAQSLVWETLRRPLNLDFPDETPLADVLRSLAQSTANDRLPKGLQFYVDPIGLQEEEKTMQSGVGIQLRDIPLATSLRLLLSQLSLRFQVHRDGIVIIRSAHDTNPFAFDGPLEMGTDQATALASAVSRMQAEIAQLRAERALSTRGLSLTGAR